MKYTDQRIRELEAEVRVLDACLADLAAAEARARWPEGHPDRVRAEEALTRLLERRTVACREYGGLLDDICRRTARVH